MLFSLSKKQYNLKKNNKFYFISPQQVILFHCTFLKSLIFIVCTEPFASHKPKELFNDLDTMRQLGVLLLPSDGH